MVTIIVLVGMVVCTTIGVHDISGLRRRSGMIAMINLVPLSPGAHMNFLVNFCGIRLGDYGRIHRWLGRMAIVEGIVHTVAALSMKRPDLDMLSDIGGLMVSSRSHSSRPARLKRSLQASVIMAIMLLSSLASVRQRFYEVFHKIHLILATTLMATLFMHSKSKKLLAPPIFYIFTTICLQILTGALQLGEVFYRNAKYRRPLGRAIVRTISFKKDRSDIPVSDAVHVHVRLSRSWRHRAGQYVYLCIPGLSHTSFAQSHPFYVAWWYREQGNHYVVLIVQRRRGLTKNLRLYASASDDPSQHPEMTALIMGPYGKGLNLESYETVMLFATGIGIAGQIAHVRQLLEGYQSGGIKTRRIALFWEMESERKPLNISPLSILTDVLVHTAWVAEMMKELLWKDRHRVR